MISEYNFYCRVTDRPAPARRLLGSSWEIEMEQQKNIRKTREQTRALKDYEYARRQEDRYLGSVFVTPAGQRAAEARTKAAYDRCKALGMTHEHGL